MIYFGGKGMNYKQSVKEIQAGIEEKLAHQFGEKAETASDSQYYKAVALMVKEMLMEGRGKFLNRAQKEKTNQKRTGKILKIK